MASGEGHSNFRRIRLADLEVPSYWAVVGAAAFVSGAVLTGHALEDERIGPRAFFAIVQLVSPLACLWYAIETRRLDLRHEQFTIHTTTIRSINAAWIGFFGFAWIGQLTSVDLGPQLMDLYVLAALTSILALVGPARSELAKAKLESFGRVVGA